MSSVSSAAGTSTSIAYTLARKSLDTYKAQGDAAVNMIKQAEKVGKEVRSGKSGRLDVVG